MRGWKHLVCLPAWRGFILVPPRTQSPQWNLISALYDILLCYDMGCWMSGILDLNNDVSPLSRYLGLSSEGLYKDDFWLFQVFYYFHVKKLSAEIPLQWTFLQQLSIIYTPWKRLPNPLSTEGQERKILEEKGALFTGNGHWQSFSLPPSLVNWPLMLKSGIMTWPSRSVSLKFVDTQQELMFYAPWNVDKSKSLKNQMLIGLI